MTEEELKKQEEAEERKNKLDEKRRKLAERDKLEQGMTDEEKKKRRNEEKKKHLINFAQRQKQDPEAFIEFQKEMSRRGVAKRRENKTLRDSLKLILSLKPMSSEKLLKEARRNGIKEDDIDNQTILMLSLFKRGKLGDVNAIKEIKSIVGEEFGADEEENRNIEVRLVLASDTR